MDISRLFKGMDAMDVKFTSVLRMNATFPYITPRVFLPTEPTIEVMDAGMRDNFGMQTTVRFLHVFKDWLNAIPEPIITLFGVGYLGYTGARTVDKVKGVAK